MSTTQELRARFDLVKVRVLLAEVERYAAERPSSRELSARGHEHTKVFGQPVEALVAA